MRRIGSHAMRAALLALLVAAAFSGCGGDGSNGATASGSGCEAVAAPDPREAPTLVAPDETLDPAKTWELVFETNCGDFTVELDLALAPETTASLVHLAREKFYDDTVFHRIVPDFVIQGGDPTQTGTGGPGYATLDVPPASVGYTKGTMAMAKSGLEPPGTAGSQFFVVSADGVNLQPQYAIVGKVSEGLDVIERIGQLGDAQERPTQPVVVRTVTVVES
jgi:peptidyl-prolyl cis-trans isomerase B (cyclophilin B)